MVDEVDGQFCGLKEQRGQQIKILWAHRLTLDFVVTNTSMG